MMGKKPGPVIFDCSSVRDDRKEIGILSALRFPGVLFAVSLVLAGASPVMADRQAQAVYGPTSAESQLPLRGLESSLARTDQNTLDELRTEAETTSGAMFVQPDQVLVKPPLLKALIQLQENLSPYQLDANKASKAITLRDVIKAALDNNLTIKISHSDQESQHWQYRAALGAFLPNLVNGFSYQGITGKYASPFGALVGIGTANLVAPASVNYYFFQGGKVLFGALENVHKYKASQFALKGAINDILLDAGKLYYSLVLNDVLLQIRVKAVETSEALLARNQIRFENGASTRLDVMQARTQLSKDRQALISQQIARRRAAIHLATALNLDTAVDLTVEDRLLSKIRLVDSSISIADLLSTAIDSRPELKHYEQLRLAAKNAVKVARAALLPTVQGTVLAAATGARVTSGGAGSQSAVTASGFAPAGFSPTSGASALSGGGGSRKKFAATEIFAMGIDIQWSLGGLGAIDAAKVQSAKWQARRAQLEFSRELAKVCQEVRDAYLDSIDAENLINETTDTVNSAREELRVATIRLDEGVGTDLDVVTAQRDYTSALIDKANAIVKFNSAQINLLRATGNISLDAVTRGIPVKHRS